MALPPSSKYLQRAADPVDDVERESLTARLNSAFAEGRVTHDEYAVMNAILLDKFRPCLGALLSENTLT